MKYTVVITKDRQGNMFATAPGLPDCAVRARTRQEAIRSMREMIADFASRSEVIQLDVPVEPTTERLPQETPWDVFGMYANDPNWTAFFEQLEHARHSSIQ